MFLTFTLTGTNAYSLAVSVPVANTNVILTGTLEGVSGTQIDRIRMFNASAGVGTPNNLYFSYLQIGTANISDATTECSTNFNCAASAKFDVAGFTSTGASWLSGQDNGYGIYSLWAIEDSGPYYQILGDINYTGGKELEGCYDVIANGSCAAESLPFYIQVVNQ